MRTDIKELQGRGSAIRNYADSVVPFVTARDGDQRLTAMPAVQWQPASEDAQPSITVRAAVRYQKIAGFGGAFTEAAASTFFKMPPAMQEEILNAYFHPRQGHGYSLCRTHINSCDFSLGNYAHANTAEDFSLRHFSIERDRRFLIPMIQRAAEVAGEPLNLFASPWSPPAWMKTNGIMNRGGRLRADCRSAWANYYCRFIKEYEREGIPIWGLTVQNEPAADQTWDSCLYSAVEERDFVRDYLGPALRREHFERVRLMIWDHNRDLLFERAQTILDDAEAAAFIWGVAFHWYGADCYHNVQNVHDSWPDKHLVFTEGCQEGGPHCGSWEMGERYARSVINDLTRWTEGWVDWNLLLDATGGPNHVGNHCSAPILADVETGTVSYQSSYYYLGHFSRFIRPGAHRILAASTNDQLETFAAQNEDGSVAVVVMNRTENPITYTLKDSGRSVLLKLSPRAIATLTYHP